MRHLYSNFCKKYLGKKVATTYVEDCKSHISTSLGGQDEEHQRALSCQRLGSLATLTTWVNTLYVRLTNSLECQDVILTWILTKLYNEAPPRTFMELRYNHEAPPWASTNRGHGISSWPMRHHHEISPRDSWNYVLNHTKIMSHQPSIKLSCIQFHVSHSCFMQGSHQTHPLQLIQSNITCIFT